MSAGPGGQKVAPVPKRRCGRPGPLGRQHQWPGCCARRAEEDPGPPCSMTTSSTRLMPSWPRCDRTGCPRLGSAGEAVACEPVAPAVGRRDHADVPVLRVEAPREPWKPASPKGEDPAVFGDEPVAGGARRHADHRTVEAQPPGRAEEPGITEPEDLTVGRHQPPGLCGRGGGASGGLPRWTRGRGRLRDQQASGSSIEQVTIKRLCVQSVTVLTNGRIGAWMRLSESGRLRGANERWLGGGWPGDVDVRRTSSRPA